MLRVICCFLLFCLRQTGKMGRAMPRLLGALRRVVERDRPLALLALEVDLDRAILQEDCAGVALHEDLHGYDLGAVRHGAARRGAAGRHQ